LPKGFQFFFLAPSILRLLRLGLTSSNFLLFLGTNAKIKIGGPVWRFFFRVGALSAECLTKKEKGVGAEQIIKKLNSNGPEEDKIKIKKNEL
jgi:hypothetical protein